MTRDAGSPVAETSQILPNGHIEENATGYLRKQPSTVRKCASTSFILISTFIFKRFHSTVPTSEHANTKRHLAAFRMTRWKSCKFDSFGNFKSKWGKTSTSPQASVLSTSASLSRDPWLKSNSCAEFAGNLIYLPHSKNIHVRILDDAKLPIGGNVSADGFICASSQLG